MKQRIINFLLRKLLNAVTIDEIISNQPKTNILLIDGNPVSQMELQSLQAEVKTLEKLRVWEILTHTLKSRAERRIFNESVHIDDIRFGKAMLYDLSLWKSILDSIKNHK
jgi:hypothetical protein